MEIKCKTIGLENCEPVIKVKWDRFAVEFKPLFNDNRIHLCGIGKIKPDDNGMLMVCPTTLTRHPTVWLYEMLPYESFAGAMWY